MDIWVIKWIKHIISEYFISALVAVIFVFTLNHFVLISRISGPSMYPTLCNGDITIFSRGSLGEVKEGDIVALHYDDENLVKRIIAMDGDEVHIEEGGIYVNGEKVIDNMQGVGLHIMTLDYEVGEDQIFVVGDNSIESYDSRMFGPLYKSAIMGRMVYRFPRLFASKAIDEISYPQTSYIFHYNKCSDNYRNIFLRK